MSKVVTDSYSDIDCIFKLILVGDSGVGKSSLLLRFADEVFQDSYICTIGVDLRIRTLRVKDKNVKLHIWDTAGQERFKTVCSHYYRGAEAVIIVYDVTNAKTFTSVRRWYQEAKALCREDCAFTLIGNKSDMSEKREVSTEEAKGLADALGMLYHETSAKISSNVSEAFISTTSDLVDMYKERRSQMGDSAGGPVINFSKENSGKGKKWQHVTSLNCFDCNIM